MCFLLPFQRRPREGNAALVTERGWPYFSADLIAHIRWVNELCVQSLGLLGDCCFRVNHLVFAERLCLVKQKHMSHLTGEWNAASHEFVLFLAETYKQRTYIFLTEPHSRTPIMVEHAVSCLNYHSPSPKEKDTGVHVCLFRGTAPPPPPAKQKKKKRAGCSFWFPFYKTTKQGVTLKTHPT